MNIIWLKFAYDLVGNKLTEQDALGAAASPPYLKSWTYDVLDRVLSETDQNGAATTYVYDLAINLRSLTVPASGNNTTKWFHDGLNRVQFERRLLSGVTQEREFRYDLAGNRVFERDRNGRITKYAYDHLHRNIQEQWFANSMDTTPDHTLNFAHDLAGNLDSSNDAFHHYTYQQDGMDRVTNVTQAITGLASTVELTLGYDLTSHRTHLSGKIGGTSDFVNQMTYDALYRLGTITQSVAGTNVSDKRVDFNYDRDGQMAWEFRYVGLSPGSGGTAAAATTRFLYDKTGRVDKIDHWRGNTSTSKSSRITGYDLDWDRANRVIGFANVQEMFLGESVQSYTYDKRGQVKTADYSASSIADEFYNYDANGNRTSSHRHATYSYANGFNQLTNDGQYHYVYDSEGNRTRKNLASSWDAGIGDYKDRQEFTWDHRDRLTSVKEYAGGVLVETVTYAYDAFNQFIRRTVANSPAGGPATTTNRFFVLDRVPSGPSLWRSGDGDPREARLKRLEDPLATFHQVAFSTTQSDLVLASAVSSPDELGQIVLQFDSTTTSGTNVQLSHRYLWGPRVDYQLSDEQLPVTNGEGVTRIVWPLTDHLGTVRDLVEYTTFTSGTPRTMLLKHRTYDSFGNLLGEYNRGDFDHDGDIDAEDIDSMLWAASQGVFGQYNGYDINGDGVVNSADTSAFVLDVIGTVFGDADMDGVCDGGDFAIWNINKFQTGDFGWAGADFNGDGAVDGGDWTIVNANLWTGDGDLNTRVVDHLFGFTGRLIDSATGLQNNLNRWYDANVGRWVSEDPIQFKAGDSNLIRYVGNGPTNWIDSNGLYAQWLGENVILPVWQMFQTDEQIANTSDAALVAGTTAVVTVGVVGGYYAGGALLSGGGAAGSSAAAGYGVGTQAVVAPGLGAGSYAGLGINGTVYCARFHDVAWQMAKYAEPIEKYGIVTIDAAGKVIGWL